MSENETRKKLLASAQKEFMENGFVKASLRKICREAGVTTGALYFFFKDKDDLFSSLVRGVYEELIRILMEHFEEEMKLFDKNRQKTKESVSLDFQMIRDVIELLYKNRNAVLLLLEHSQGTKYENCVDDLVYMTEKAYRVLLGKIAQEVYGSDISNFMIHLFAHMQTDAFIEIICHVEDKEEAHERSIQVVRFLFGGWIGLWEMKLPGE